MPEVTQVTTRIEIARCYPVIHQLRPHLDEDTFVNQALRQIKEHHYRLAATTEESRVTAVAGYRVSECLAWGRFMYVDDLVTDESLRGTGHGGVLLDWLIEEARRHGCREFHLDSGVQRFAAHRFYLKKGMDITSHHFGLRLY